MEREITMTAEELGEKTPLSQLRQWQSQVEDQQAQAHKSRAWDTLVWLDELWRHYAEAIAYRHFELGED